MRTLLQPSGAKRLSANDFDHVYEIDGAITGEHVYLYGIPGSSSFCALYDTLTHGPLKAVSSEEASGTVHSIGSFAVRPALSLLQASRDTSASTATRLQGYGVFLDIKNMEYKNVDTDEDDKKASSAAASSSATSEDHDEEHEIKTEDDDSREVR